MKYLLARLLYHLTFESFPRLKWFYKSKNNTNQICVYKADGKKRFLKLFSPLRGFKAVVCGKNNLIKIENSENIDFKNTSIVIFGDNNTITLREFSGGIYIKMNSNNSAIILEKGCKIGASSIFIGNIGERKVQNNIISIGCNSAINGANIQTFEDNSIVSIGRDCLFSWGIDIWCSDSHTVVDKKGNAINCGKFITIGNHVWICKDVKICKNTKISDNSIVGWGSVVCGIFEQENAVIAGNPARIVKKDINWDKKRYEDYLLSNNVKNPQIPSGGGYRRKIKSAA